MEFTLIVFKCQIIFSLEIDLFTVIIKKTKTYMPETILSLDAAYQNARLIAKPDELWMNPDLVE